MTPWIRMVTSEAGCFISKAGIIWCLIEYGLSETREKSGMIRDVFDLSYYVNAATIFWNIENLRKIRFAEKINYMYGWPSSKASWNDTDIPNSQVCTHTREVYRERVLSHSLFLLFLFSLLPSLPFPLPASFSLSFPLLFFFLIVLRSGDQTQCST